MRYGRHRSPDETALARPEFFEALDQALVVTCVAEGRWTVSVAGGSVPGTFRIQVEAWEAGVRAADSHARLRPRVG